MGKEEDRDFARLIWLFDSDRKKAIVSFFGFLAESVLVMGSLLLFATRTRPEWGSLTLIYGLMITFFIAATVGTWFHWRQASERVADHLNALINKGIAPELLVDRVSPVQSRLAPWIAIAVFVQALMLLTVFLLI